MSIIKRILFSFLIGAIILEVSLGTESESTSRTPSRSSTPNGTPETTPELDKQIIQQADIIYEAVTFDYQNIIPNNLDIAFPTNWRQPDLKSCKIHSKGIQIKNLDKKRNIPQQEITFQNFIDLVEDPVTQWYMKQFLLSPKENGCEVLAAAAKLNPNSPIISFNFDKVQNFTLRNGISKEEQKNILEFLKAFHKIASNQVGRMLLYRLLIEIYRPGGGLGKDILNVIKGVTSQTKDRSINRTLNICFGNPMQYLTKTGEKAKIFFDTYNNGLSTIAYKEDETAEQYPIVLYPDEPSIALFHEMLHWFHHLRHPSRVLKEEIAYGSLIGPVKLHDGGTQHTIGTYFWKGLQENKDNHWKISAYQWITKKDKKLRVDFEEMRTILGAPTREEFYEVCVEEKNEINNIRAERTYNFFDGDELSENMYRASLPKGKLRFGHSLTTFYEDKDVIDRVINLVENGNEHLLTLQEIEELQPHLKPSYKKGLGNFEAGVYNNNVNKTLP